MSDCRCCGRLWLYDVAYYSANVLLAMLSTQLYQLSSEEEEAEAVSLSNESDDLFMRYMYGHMDRQFFTSATFSDHDLAGNRWEGRIRYRMLSLVLQRLICSCLKARLRVVWCGDWYHTLWRG